MEYRTTDLRTGLFVALSILAATALIFLMGGIRGAFRDAQEVKFRFADAQMLEVDSPVTIGGFRVGEVSDVQRVEVEAPDGTSRSEVEVTLAIDVGVRLHDDATAMVRQDGFIGSKFVALSPGVSRVPHEAGRVLTGTAEVQLGDVIADLRRPLAQASRILDEVHAIVSDKGETGGSPRNVIREASLLLQRARGTTLPKLERLSETIGREVVNLGGQLQGTTSRLEARLDKSLAGVDGLTKSVTNRSEEAKPAIASAQVLLEDLRLTIGEVRTVIARLETTVNNTNAGVVRIVDGADRLLTDNNRNIFVMVQELRDMAAALERGARKLQADPSVLIWGDDEPVRPPSRSLGIDAIRESGRAKRYEKEPGR